VKRTFEAFRKMEDGDFRVLSSIEAGLRRGDYVARSDLLKYAKMDDPDLEYHLRRLDEFGLTERTRTPYLGYRLLHTAYDFLALNVLVQRDDLENLGDRIAVGKESEIYEVTGSGGRSMILKLHRLGLTSFHQTTRLRTYLGNRRHFSWIYAARLAAEREFEALRRLEGKVKVPEPLDQNRNALLMERFDGLELVNCELEEPRGLLKMILEEVERALELEIIHGDLSEFNIMVGDDDFVLIDWPQWLDASHPQARSIMERDLDNIFNYFVKKRNLDEGNASAMRARSMAYWSRRNTSSSESTPEPRRE
jgi:RIO kinase 2